MSMFPMTPLQSWVFLILVLTGVACLVHLFIRLDGAISADPKGDAVDPAAEDRDRLADIPVWLLDFDAEDSTPASFDARGGPS